jgi:ankyrin repeat protein
MVWVRLLLGLSLFAGAWGFAPPTPVRAAESDERSSQALLEAVRAGDKEGVRRLLRDGTSANARAADGTSALMRATAVGDIELLRILLDHGADVNARNKAGATALMWASGDLDKVRALVDRGAVVNTHAESGRTPLMIAVGRPGAAELVKFLIEKGADVRYGHQGYTVLMAAAASGDRAVIRQLLAGGADVKARNRVGYTALHAAALAGNRGVVEDLLASGADVNAADTIQGRTPLLWAANTGRADIVRVLLDHGANLRVRESLGGTTPLICATGSERGDLGLVNLLIEKGADLDAKDSRGDTALDWARRRGNRDLVEALARKGVRARAAAESSRALPRLGDNNTVARAVNAALPLLQGSSDTFFSKTGQGCVSCHHQSLPALALQLARQNGFRVDEAKASQQAVTTRRLLAGRRERFLQGTGAIDQLDAGYWLLALAAAGVSRDDTTDALVHYLTLKQAPDGHWRTTLFRPPSNDSAFTATALAVRGLRLLGPPGRTQEIAGRVARARAWLVSATPRTTEDRTFQLLGLKWAGAANDDLRKAAAGLLAEQGKDGGWSQLASLPGDAYATGQALVALSQSGVVAVAEPAYRRGTQFLLRTQLADGSWFVQSRSLPVQPDFESGFPHGRSQFISCAATSWATSALALTAASPGGARVTPRR